MNKQNKFYYQVIKSWWEYYYISNVKVKARRRLPIFRFETYEDAREAAIKLRKIDPYYIYNFGDRIYVRKQGVKKKHE